jgi:hypothetical protein
MSYGSALFTKTIERNNLPGKVTCGQKRHTSNPTKPACVEQHLLLARFPEVRKDTPETRGLGNQRSDAGCQGAARKDTRV